MDAVPKEKRGDVAIARWHSFGDAARIRVRQPRDQERDGELSSWRARALVPAAPPEPLVNTLAAARLLPAGDSGRDHAEHNSRCEYLPVASEGSGDRCADGGEASDFLCWPIHRCAPLLTYIVLNAPGHDVLIQSLWPLTGSPRRFTRKAGGRALV